MIPTCTTCGFLHTTIACQPLPADDDQEAALDALPEDPPDKQERWRAAPQYTNHDDLNAIREELIAHLEENTLPPGYRTRASLLSALGEVSARLQALQSSHAPPQQTARDVVVNTLEVAAINLRDAELAKARAVAAYQRALDAFNRFVAPVPTP